VSETLTAKDLTDFWVRANNEGARDFTTKEVQTIIEAAQKGLVQQGLEEAAQAIVTHAAYRQIDGDYMGKIDVVVMPIEDLRQLEIVLRAVARPDLGLYAAQEAAIKEDEKTI
jgi:hypothetical protein